MNTTVAVITDSTIVLAEVNDSGLTSQLIAEAARPESFEAAATFLAEHGYRVDEVYTGWDLCGAGVQAQVRKLDNLFNGVRAADLNAKVGTTHSEFFLCPASKVENGDLVTDQDRSETYLVAGSSTESGSTKLHMVRDGGEWSERHTGEFTGLVWAAHKL